MTVDGVKEPWNESWSCFQMACKARCSKNDDRMPWWMISRGPKSLRWFKALQLLENLVKWLVRLVDVHKGKGTTYSFGRLWNMKNCLPSVHGKSALFYFYRVFLKSKLLERTFEKGNILHYIRCGNSTATLLLLLIHLRLSRKSLVL